MLLWHSESNSPAGALARARRWQGALEVFEELVSRQISGSRLGSSWNGLRQFKVLIS